MALAKLLALKYSKLSEAVPEVSPSADWHEIQVEREIWCGKEKNRVTPIDWGSNLGSRGMGEDAHPGLHRLAGAGFQYVDAVLGSVSVTAWYESCCNQEFQRSIL